jgi:predicted mannosyl-3-phosphoglycerate phosphatase (HAD superfamily)
MCTGGALFLSREAYNRIETVCGNEIGQLRHSDLADDLLLALCNAAAGFKMKDFSDRDDIMAINWRGLPMPLDELVQRKKKLLHPVKDPKNLDHERKVRKYFKEIRNVSAPSHRKG